MSSQREDTSGGFPMAPPPSTVTSPEVHPANDLAMISLVLGPAALFAVLLPGAVLLAPMLGTAAIVAGVLGFRRVPPGYRYRTVIGIALGVAAVVSVATLLVSFLLASNGIGGADFLGSGIFGHLFTGAGRGDFGPGGPGPDPGRAFPGGPGR